MTFSLLENSITNLKVYRNIITKLDNGCVVFRECIDYKSRDFDLDKTVPHVGLKRRKKNFSNLQIVA